MSTIVTDTITGKSTATTITIGSTPVVSASANSMTIRGEGSNQTSIQQGLAKAWLQGSNSAALEDSFNISGGTDHGTGDYSYNLANVFSNADYSQPCSGRVASGYCRIAMFNASRQNASTLAIHTENSAGTPVNVTHVISALGDLA